MTAESIAPPIVGAGIRPRLLRDGQLKHLLALRFAIVNVAAVALLGAAYAQGWVTRVFDGDTTGLSMAIFLTFVVGFAMSIAKAWRISVELDHVADFAPGPNTLAGEYLASIAGRDSGARTIIASVLQERIAGRIATVRQFANSLVLLGLVGTVLGFIIALSGVDPKTVGNVEAVAPMVGELIRGMSIALHTTLIGAVLSLWLTVSYHILAGGALKLVTQLVSRGEANAPAWSS